MRLFSTILLASVVTAKAFNPIASTNLIDWTKYSGIPSWAAYGTNNQAWGLGIPTYSVYTNLSSGVTTDDTGNNATIVNNAINAAAFGKVVTLPAGTIRFTADIVMKRGVELAGQGTTTILHLVGCHIVFNDYGGSRSDVTTTGNVADGATSVTLSSAPATLAAGGIMWLNETNASDVYPFRQEECGGERCGYCDNYFGGYMVRGQHVYVTNISGSTVSFTPPIVRGFTTANGAQAHWKSVGSGTNNGCDWAGLRDMAIDDSEASALGNVIYMYDSYFCWITNVSFKINNNETWTILLQDSAFNIITHCDFTGYQGRDSAIGIYVNNSGHRVENNWFNRMHLCAQQSGLGLGNAIVFNSLILKTNIGGNTAIIAEWGTHGAWPDLLLFEGNSGIKYHLDDIHGGSMRGASFRNAMRGRETNSTYSMGCFFTDYKNIYSSQVGNILGYKNISVSEGYLWKYGAFGNISCAAYTNANGFTPLCYDTGGNQDPDIVGSSGATAEPTVTRHINYSYSTIASVAGYTNASNVEYSTNYASSGLDSSIIYNTAGKPPYWGNRAWPWVKTETVSSSYFNDFTANNLQAALTNQPAGYRFYIGGEPPAGSSGSTTNTITLKGGTSVKGITLQ